ncbi:MAG: hypothetical protein U0872_08755 [Planctomycetaceae bacterium]
MNRNLLLPAFAVLAFTFMSWHMLKMHQPVPEVEPPSPPSRNPFTKTIAGAGLVGRGRKISRWRPRSPAW